MKKLWFRLISTQPAQVQTRARQSASFPEDDVMSEEKAITGFICRFCADDEFEDFTVIGHTWRAGFCDVCGRSSSVMDAMESGGLAVEPPLRDPEGD
ncbi:hypothetical protein CCP4SC76_7640014 [Gammaproteobacteria bacterium]